MQRAGQRSKLKDLWHTPGWPVVAKRFFFCFMLLDMHTTSLALRCVPVSWYMTGVRPHYRQE